MKVIVHRQIVVIRAILLVLSLLWGAQASAGLCDETFLSPQLLGLTKFAGENAAEDPVWIEFTKTSEYQDLGLYDGQFKVTKLGAGVTGTVFLVRDFNQNQKYAIKFFKGPSHLERDLLAFDFLDDLIEKHFIQVSTPKRERLGPQSLKLEYIEGITIRTAGGFAAVQNTPDRDLLLEADEDFVEVLATVKTALEHLKKHTTRYTVERLINGLRSKSYAIQDNDQGGLRFGIYLKDDNFLYNPITDELWIIDPY